MSAIEVPASLESLDDRLGTNTVEAYEHSIRLAPHLGSVAIVLDDQGFSRFHKSDSGLADSYVALNPRHSYYVDAIKAGRVRERMGEFSAFFRNNGIIPKIPELILSVFLHELGHANDYHSYIEQAGGDTLAAYRHFVEVRQSQLATLPLGMATSYAERELSQQAGRRGLTGPYQSNDNWAEILERNTRAYARLPSEQVADRFALGVLATMYS